MSSSVRSLLATFALFASCVATPRPGWSAPPLVTPPSADAELRARELFAAGEAAATAGDHATAALRYQEAYYLVPGRHGLAYKVGVAAFEAGDCARADEYLRHFSRYETDVEGKAEELADAKRRIGELAAGGCGTAGETISQLEQVDLTAPARDDEVPPPARLKDARDHTPTGGEPPSEERISGLLVGGITATALGGAGIVLAVTSRVQARRNSVRLSELSSSDTPTGFPQGDYSKRSTKRLFSQLETYNTLAIVGVAVAGVGLATGTTLITLGVLDRRQRRRAHADQRSGSRTPRLTGVYPTLAPGRVGGGVGARFSF